MLFASLVFALAAREPSPPAPPATSTPATTTATTTTTTATTTTTSATSATSATAAGPTFVGARALVVADAFSLAPDLGHTGGGVDVVVGQRFYDGMFSLGGSLELRHADIGFGYCIERCNLTGTPPKRTQPQLQLVPAVEVEMRLVELGPLGLTIGMRTGAALSTSTTGDPLAVGFHHAMQVGARAALPAGVIFETHARFETANHFVPDAPTNAMSVAYVVDAGFVYAFDVDAR